MQYACMTFTMNALAAAALGLHWSDFMIMLYEVMLWFSLAMLWLCYVMAAAMVVMSAKREAVLWLSCQPG